MIVAWPKPLPNRFSWCGLLTKMSATVGFDVQTLATLRGRLTIWPSPIDSSTWVLGR